MFKNSLGDQLGIIILIILGYSSLLLHKAYISIPTPRCFINNITGFPCPGCGMSRASLALLNGDIQLSLSYNVLCIPFTIAIITALIWLTLDIFRKRTTFFNFVKQDINTKQKVLLFTALIIVAAINIIRL